MLRASQYNLLTELPPAEALMKGVPSFDQDKEGWLKSPQIRIPLYLDLDAAVMADNISRLETARTDKSGL